MKLGSIAVMMALVLAPTAGMAATAPKKPTVPAAAPTVTQFDQGDAAWGRADYATASGVSLDTIKRVERMRGPIAANTSTEAAIRKALEAAGVILIDENGDGPGVRLRKAGAA